MISYVNTIFNFLKIQCFSMCCRRSLAYGFSFISELISLSDEIRSHSALQLYHTGNIVNAMLKVKK